MMTVKYPLAIRLLHWLMALMIIGLLAVGLIMAGMPKSDPLRALLFSLHKSFGLTVLCLAVLRLALRLRLSLPPLPVAIPRLERILAHLGHYGLYGFMIALPVTGYVMSTSYGLTVKWFGLTLPKLVGVDIALGRLANEAHQWLAYLLIGIIAVHVTAVIKHYAKDRINLLKRMW